MSIKQFVFAAVVVAFGAGAGAALAQDAPKILQDRQAVMKGQSKAMEAVKAYIDDKGDLAAAQAAGTNLDAEIKKIPTLFPKDTGMAQFPGKSGAKPAVWTEADKFSEAWKTAEAKAAALNVALKGGDKAAITAAFGEMGKLGCGGCHTPFREKI
jgi:cytochrome c556